MQPKVFLTSNVFQKISENEKINPQIREKIKELWEQLRQSSNLKVFDGRFPEGDQIKTIINEFNPHILGCHLSHPISAEWIENSKIFAICTSTVGYNHIEKTEKDDIIITHTPGVLHHTVADYTIALIMANLRNLIDLHQYVWEGDWTAEDKWDLDQSLSSVIDRKVIGIVGLGEIGTEVLKRLYPWGLKIIYYDKNRCRAAEEKYPDLECKSTLAEVFEEADIITLHIPLNSQTKHLIDEKLLKRMKNNALLVNTARGGVLNFDDLLELLETKQIKINLAFDVVPVEPIAKETLKRLKKIKQEQPDIRMILMPHNASADADTRGKMDIIFLEDILRLISSHKLEDLEEVRIIPEHRNQIANKKWKIYDYWGSKK